MQDEEAGAAPRKVSVRALLVAERLDTRRLERGATLAVSPLTVQLSADAYAVAFRFGAVVTFGVTPETQGSLLTSLARLATGALSEPVADEVDATIDPAGQDRVGADGEIIVKDLAPERLQVLADVLAKSVVLEHYEGRISAVFDRVEPLAANLGRRAHARSQARELLRHTGEALLTQHRMIGRVEVAEKPEVLWEHPELERFYARLEQEYELRERSRALDRKLDLISRTVSTLLDLLQNQRSLRVEWYIVLLILVEILLTLYNMFVVA